MRLVEGVEPSPSRPRMRGEEGRGRSVAGGRERIAAALEAVMDATGQDSAAAGGGATLWGVTAKEKLLDRVGKLSEAEAEATLRIFEDPVLKAFGEAPEDDEPFTEADVAAVREAEEDPSPSIPLEEIKVEFGIE